MSELGTAFITGASSGIGEAYARELASRGYDLILTARREHRLQALARELTDQYGIHTEILVADLTKSEDVARLENRIREISDLTMLVNNAGFGTLGKFQSVALQKHLDIIAVHVLVTVRLCYAALPGMIAHGGGDIINVSSIAAFFHGEGNTTYGATKAYLNSFSQTLQTENKNTGIRVQALCPGYTVTEFHDTPDYAGFNRAAVPRASWMTAQQVVIASLNALDGKRIVFIPSRRNRWVVKSITGGWVYRPARWLIHQLRKRARPR